MTGRRRTTMAFWLACAVVGPAWAEKPSQKMRAEAHSEGQAGIDACKRGDYRTAVGKLEQAYSLVKAPSLAFWLARALRGQGKLMQAAERYSEAARLDVTSGDPEIQQLAQQQAAEERASLLPLIPGLKIEIEDAAPEAVEVRVDGEVIPNAALGKRWPVDPGEHRVAARTGRKAVEERLKVDAGETKRVLLRLGSAGMDERRTVHTHRNTAGPGGAPRVAQSPRQIDSPTTGSSGSMQRTVGWVTLGVGGAGIAVWGITGLAGLVWARDLDQRCPNRACPPPENSQLDRYHALRTLSTAGFATGLVGVGAGATLLLTAPKERVGGTPTAQVAPFVGVKEVGLRGEF